MDGETPYDTSEEPKGWLRGASAPLALGGALVRGIMGLPAALAGTARASSEKETTKRRRRRTGFEGDGSEDETESEDDGSEDEASPDESSPGFDGDYPEPSAPPPDDDGHWAIVTDGISLPVALAGITLATIIADSMKERSDDCELRPDFEDDAESNDDAEPNDDAQSDDDGGPDDASVDSDDDDPESLDAYPNDDSDYLESCDSPPEDDGY